jgi:hypothetical protein
VTTLHLRVGAACAGLVATIVLAALAAAFLGLTRSTPVDFDGPSRLLDVALLTGAVAFAAVGALVLLRRPGNSVAWIFLAMGLLMAGTVFAQEFAVYAILAHPGSVPGGATAAWFQSWSFLSCLTTGLGLLMLVFPDGRLLGRRWRLAAWGAAIGFASFFAGAFAAPETLEPPFSSVHNPYGIDGAAGVALRLTNIGWALSLVALLAGALSLMLRFRRAHGVERQQIKWLAYAGTALALAFVATTVLYDVSDVGAAIAATFVGAALVAIPVAAGVAILRYRLYEIDVVINRTLVYGSLTALLAGAYFGLVLLLQLALRPLTEGNGLAIALSTLAVAALFRPARNRIQALVDRRFYRHKFDSERTLAHFAAQLRDEVDLDALRSELTGVVTQTMQPAHVSLWLRDGRVAVTPAVTIPGRSPATRKRR